MGTNREEEKTMGVFHRSFTSQTSCFFLDLVLAQLFDRLLTCGKTESIKKKNIQWVGNNGHLLKLCVVKLWIMHIIQVLLFLFSVYTTISISWRSPFKPTFAMILLPSPMPWLPWLYCQWDLLLSIRLWTSGLRFQSEVTVYKESTLCPFLKRGS